MATFDNILCSTFYCEKCDYSTSKKSSFKSHSVSKRHKNNILATKTTQVSLNTHNQKKYTCEKCLKTFNDRSGLWRHNKKCTEQCDKNIYYDGIDIINKDTLVLQLLKQNSELQKSLIEMSKEKSINNTNNITNTNCATTNNAFNLNIFLNETCKDAMNITDFVSSININLDDLENTGRQGYIEGISKIIIKNLNNLEQCFRPLHCCDLKREVLYIKDNDKWEKETNEKPILTKAIKIIANENIKQIQNWKNKYPDCLKSDSRKNDLYLKIVSNAMSGLTKEECDKNLNKIISNVSKQVIIQKS
jgi:hypothetical protein